MTLENNSNNSVESVSDCIDFNSNRLANIGSGVSASDAVTMRQAQESQYCFGVDTSAEVNKIQINLTPSITAYKIGQRFLFKAKNTNTGDCSFSVGSIGECKVTFNGSNAPAGAIVEGVIYEGVYDCDAALAGEAIYNGRRFHVLGAGYGGGSERLGDVVVNAFSKVVAGREVLDGHLISKVNKLYPEFYSLVNDYGIKITMAEYEAELTDNFGNCGKFAIDTDEEGDITLRLPTIKDHIKGVNSLADIATCVNDQLQNMPKANVGQFWNYSPNNPASTQAPFKDEGLGWKDGTGGGSDVYARMISFDISTVVRTGDKTEVRSVQYPYSIIVADSVNPVSQMVADNLLAQLNGKADINLGNISTEAKNNIARTAALSDSFVDLELPASSPEAGTEYIAPGDGAFVFSRTSAYAGQYVYINRLDKNSIVVERIDCNSHYQGVVLNIRMACKKGDKIKLFYMEGGPLIMWRFIYSEGAI